MTAGEGGIIITNDDELERSARSVHDCGRMPGEWFYSHFIYGSNYRLSEWQGAVLTQQLSRLDKQAAIRTENAAYLDRALSEIEGITPQKHDPRCTRNGHYAYIFHYNSRAFEGVPIKRFIQALEAEGIPTQASYPPIHELELFKNKEYLKRLPRERREAGKSILKSKFAKTRRAAWETVWLPHPVLLGTDEDTAKVVEAVRKIQKHAKELV
jgi:dTDP-4-amino-4,6-dideoxygalactose transaminase